ncbi:hypothetical protein G3R41_13065 [Modestobacter muralis]|uniref:Uncharacterized protein n=1 Tax=Modestobacter muralis TaxID=1608614 RepID=A0A6P0HCX3_9ACTN|nr:hypothetical protein [Modestobacter muralis]NEN51854.1 hypothetical protein [Modestobacter muralis]
MTEAFFDPDGSCRLIDRFERTEIRWPSVEAWAADWATEWRSHEWGGATDFMHVACDDRTPGVVEALVVLAESAAGDADLLAMIGAGPMEHLLSHSGHGLAVLPDADRAARRSQAFRTALGSVLLGSGVPKPVSRWWAEFDPRRTERP